MNKKSHNQHPTSQESVAASHVTANLIAYFQDQENWTYVDGRLPSVADVPDLSKATRPAKTPVRDLDTDAIRVHWQAAAETAPGYTGRINELGEAMIIGYGWRRHTRKPTPNHGRTRQGIELSGI